eukprot:TRINITY_DN317_c0_g1_i3.p1 TRINITY_DN317_c0_g1~~TRINITY_DN317_c0_g1_i3.p1  ORF type:complete len:348 (+),score=66.04 TRINITY_DN317_c0_g1_i3:52-1095(+)
MKMMSTLLLSLAALMTSGTVISNVDPRKDTTGSILNAHDGNILHMYGEYYWYSIGYGDCTENPGCSKAGVNNSCGFMFNHSVTLYTSKDLSSGSWVNRGNVLPVQNRPMGIVFASTVVYNNVTDQYVLWANYLPSNNFQLSRYFVATSKSRFGPFDVVNPHVNLTRSPQGDSKIFVDDDGQGYIIYTTVEKAGHLLAIERLTPDFIYSQGDSAPLNPSGCMEAPSVFIDRESGKYFALASECCCFCSEGGDVEVYSSDSILGNYTHHGSINQKRQIPAQQTYVLPVNTTSGWQYIWIGDRWGSAPDKLKSHDFTYWGLLNWTGAGSGRLPQTMEFVDQFDVNLADSF